MLDDEPHGSGMKDDTTNKASLRRCAVMWRGREGNLRHGSRGNCLHSL